MVEVKREDQLEIVAYLRQQLELSKFGIERFKFRDDDMFFYTGFPNYDTLMVFCDYVKPCADSSNYLEIRLS